MEALQTERSDLAARVALLEVGTGLGGLSVAELEGLQAQLAASLARAQKEALYRQFKKMHGIDQEHESSEALAPVAEEKEGPDPLIAQLKAQLEEVSAQAT